MKTISRVVGVVFGIGCVAIVAAHPVQGASLLSATILPTPPSKEPCKQHLDAAGYTHVLEGDCSPAEKAEYKPVDAAMKKLRDLWATGSRSASAEWHSIKDADVICGITPTDRYLVIHNAIGKTKYDEPSAHDWANRGCAATEPVHQAEAEQQLTRQTIQAINRRTAADNETVMQVERQRDAAISKLREWQECQGRVVTSSQAINDLEHRDAIVRQACGDEPQL